MLSARRARQLFAIHRWTGLWTGLIILFLSVTGSILVFKTEIDRWLNRELLVSVPSSGGMISPEQAVATMRRGFPGAEISGIDLPQSPTSVYTAFATMGGSFNQIAVDPYSGELRGVRDYRKSFADVTRQLHLRFYAFSWYGRVVVGLFGVTLLLSSLTGLLIYGRFIKALPHWWSIRRERGLQISTSDWHKLIGILALAFNLVIAFTGAVLGLENLARFAPAAREAIHPRPPSELAENVPATLQGAIPASEAVRRAEAAIPGFEPASIGLPEAGERHYQLFGKLRGGVERSNPSRVTVHALTGEILYRQSTRDARLITRIYNWMDPLHFGYFGGIWTKVLWLVFGLTSGFLSVTGFMIWLLKRRPSKKPRRRATGAGSGVAPIPAQRGIGTSSLHPEVAE